MHIKKRGKKATLEISLFWLMDILIFAVVFFLMMIYVDKTVESTTFEKHFLARDSALLIDTLYISPGNTIINYPQNTLWFSFNFNKNKVEVYEDETTRKPSSYFTEDKNMIFNYKDIQPEKKADLEKTLIEEYNPFFTYTPELEEGASVKLVFSKTGKDIVVDKQERAKLDTRLLECPYLEEETVQGAPPIISWLVNDPNELSPDLITKVDSAHISVITFTGSYPDKTTNNMKAYIPIDENKFKKSKKLACMILNNIIKNNNLKDTINRNSLIDITGISIIPSDSFSVLNNGNIIVLIEMGNTNIEENKNILLNQDSSNAIQESINRAIEDMLK
jgi:hypothetical protein|tara:strand:- start:57 stop:1058 length:1002 start_codon:yes stop_codon:yes gene_type:complete